MTSDPIPVAIWPSHMWCALEERSEMDALRQTFGDDYYVVHVTNWEPDGGPAPEYFK